MAKKALLKREGLFLPSGYTVEGIFAPMEENIDLGNRWFRGLNPQSEPSRNLA